MVAPLLCLTLEAVLFGAHVVSALLRRRAELRKSNAEIGRSCSSLEQTTKTHVGRILVTLHLRDRVQAAVLPYESGLISPME